MTSELSQLNMHHKGRIKLKWMRNLSNLVFVFWEKKKKLLKVFENLWNLDWNICRDYETESCCFTWGENTWEFNCVYIPHLIIAIFLTTVTNTTKTLTLRHLSTFPVDRKWLNLVWKHTWVPKLLFLSHVREHKYTSFTFLYMACGLLGIKMVIFLSSLILALFSAGSVVTHRFSED